MTAQKHPVEAAMTVELTYKGETVDTRTGNQTLGLLQIEGPTMPVQVGLGRTVNLGNYEGVKAYVGVTIPVGVNDAAADAGFERAAAWVERRLQQLLVRTIEHIAPTPATNQHPKSAGPSKDSNPFG